MVDVWSQVYVDLIPVQLPHALQLVLNLTLSIFSLSFFHFAIKRVKLPNRIVLRIKRNFILGRYVTAPEHLAQSLRLVHTH